jgi:hypothetical protein
MDNAVIVFTTDVSITSIWRGKKNTTQFKENTQKTNNKQINLQKQNVKIKDTSYYFVSCCLFVVYTSISYSLKYALNLWSF